MLSKVKVFFDVGRARLCSRVLQQMQGCDTRLSFFSLFLKTGKTFDCRLSSGTPQANYSLEVSASIGEISLLHPFSTLAFSPSGPDAF